MEKPALADGTAKDESAVLSLRTFRRRYAVEINPTQIGRSTLSWLPGRFALL